MSIVFSDKLDGWEKKKWWERVRSFGPTITFIKTSGGNVCCAYTGNLWQNVGFQKDTNAFLLSLTHRKKFLPKSPYYAVYMKENEGPNFGLGVLYIADGPVLNG